MKTKKFLYDQELTHSLTKMNGKKIIDSFAKLFCHHTNWQNATKAGRTNSRTNCQQNRIAISPLFLRGSKRDASTDHIVLAGVINLTLPFNLLDGLRWEAVFIIFLVHPFGRSVPFFFSSSSQLIVGFSSFGSFA
jgi:hypothetical protein